MSDWKLPWAAQCRCERVRMRITGTPILTMACHCGGCQRMTASAYSLSVLLPASGFEVVEGVPVMGGNQGLDRHSHCPYCKSWLFTQPRGMDAFVNVRATMLEDHAWFSPFVETCTAEGFPWARTGAPHSFPDMPSAEMFRPVVADFVARGPRP